LPRLPETPEEGAESLLAAGIAPATPEAGKATAGAIDAEMRALADALSAEMGETAPMRAEVDGAKTQDKR
jgi:hypothetical protein